MCGCECCQTGDPTCFDPSHVDSWGSFKAWVCGCTCPGCVSRVIQGAFDEGRKTGLLVGLDAARDALASVAIANSWPEEPTVAALAAIAAQRGES